MTDLTPEQRSALAKFLGYSRIYHSSDSGFPSYGVTNGWRVVDGPAHFHRSDADLMLELLNRADTAQQLLLAAALSGEAWEAAIEKREPDFPRAVIFAALQLPKAQPAQPGSGERIRPRGRLICVDCRNEFIDPWRCATCGAQKLYDETVRQQAAKIDRLQSALAAIRTERDALRRAIAEPAPDVQEAVLRKLGVQDQLTAAQQRIAELESLP